MTLASAPAHAGRRIYWANSGPEEGISWANLDGSGGGTLATGDASVDKPGGVAIDPASGKIYWANEGDNTISWAYLDGSGGGDLDTTGATVDEPLSVSIDEAAGRIYWGNAQGISYASLSGGGGGDLSLAGATSGFVDGIAVDPSLGLAFWANVPSAEADHLSEAKLDGSGGFDLGTGSFHPEKPFGVAMDNAESILYFLDEGSEAIYASIGPGGPVEIAAGAVAKTARGLAVDPIAGLAYWLNPGTNAVLFAPTFENRGGSPGAVTATGAVFSNPSFPALLAPPTAVNPPSIGIAGSSAVCGQGEWGGDFGESQYFRAPASFSYSWTHDGQPLSSHSSTIPAPESGSGSYECRVTASNAAGSAEQASGTITVKPPPKEERPAPQGSLAIGKPKLNKKKGTATLPVSVPSAGDLSLSGKGLVGRRSSPSGPGLVNLVIKARGKTAAALRKKGRAKVSATISFTPTGGAVQTGTEKLTLLLRPARRAHG